MKALSPFCKNNTICINVSFAFDVCYRVLILRSVPQVFGKEVTSVIGAP